VENVAAERRDGRRARWDQHRATRRQELIAATVEAVRDLGPLVGMDDIAHHAGVSKPVFYRYFSDKADLHHAVGQVVAQWVVHQVTRAMDAEGAVRDRVAAGIDCYLGLIEANPELYDYIVHGAPSRWASSSQSTDLVEDYATIVGVHASQVIGAGLREAGADAGAAEPWGFGVVGMVRAAADRWLEHPTMSRADLVNYLADLVSPGLLAAIDEAGATAAVEHLGDRRRRQA
jgi:AcrR family transcriptional regulator